LTRTGVDASSVDTTNTKTPDQTNPAGEQVKGGTVTTIQTTDPTTPASIPKVTLSPADDGTTATKPVIRLDDQSNTQINGIKQGASDGAVIVGNGAKVATSNIDLSDGSRKLDVAFESTDSKPTLDIGEVKLGSNSELAVKGDGTVILRTVSGGTDSKISFNGTALNFETCAPSTSSSTGGSASSASTLSPLLATVFVLFSSLVSLFFTL